MTANKRGIDILHDPVLNKSTAYTEAEQPGPRLWWAWSRT